MSLFKKEKYEITVLIDFDGLNPIVHEQVLRVIQRGGYRDRRGRPQQQPKYVSYMGRRADVFALRDFGWCISVNSYDLVDSSK